MEVILRQAIEKVGEEGEEVKVADGYARNYLLPKGLAVKATKKNLAMLLKRKKDYPAASDAQIHLVWDWEMGIHCPNYTNIYVHSIPQNCFNYVNISFKYCQNIFH